MKNISKKEEDELYGKDIIVGMHCKGCCCVPSGCVWQRNFLSWCTSLEDGCDDTWLLVAFNR